MHFKLFILHKNTFLFNLHLGFAINIDVIFS